MTPADGSAAAAPFAGVIVIPVAGAAVPGPGAGTGVGRGAGLGVGGARAGAAGGQQGQRRRGGETGQPPARTRITRRITEALPVRRPRFPVRADRGRTRARRDRRCCQRQLGQRPPLVQGHEGQITGDEHQAGDPRADRRRGEPPVGLQQSVQHHRQPVEQRLGGKYLEHVAGDRDHVGSDTVRVRVARVQQRGNRPGRDHNGHRQRYRDNNGPGQQRRGDLADPGLLLGISPGSLRRPGQHRYHRAGQRATQDEFIQEIGHLVRGYVRRAQAVRANGLREHQRADQAQDPGQYREASHHGGPAGDALPESLRQTGFARRRQASALVFAVRRMQVLIPMHARPPSSYSAAGSGRIRVSWGTKIYIGRPSRP